MCIKNSFSYLDILAPVIPTYYTVSDLIFPFVSVQLSFSVQTALGLYGV